MTSVADSNNDQSPAEAGPTATPARIRTYKLRRSRVTSGQADAIHAHGDDYLLPAIGQLLQLPQDVCEGAVDTVMEIGFGMGEATVEMAAAEPQVGLIAVDLHTPGVGRLIAALAAAGLQNVKIIEGDAIEVLQSRIPDGALAGVRLLFPDPWPKARHHKRRFVNAANLELLAAKVRPGGFFHFATDWPDYASHAAEVLNASTHWQLLPAGSGVALAEPKNRPQTRFEARGIAADRPITDLVAVLRR